MGSNLLGQLGIGQHHVQALQPMHIPEFDGMNINLIEAGQYHNAVYADGVLYTWGWGVYGQLGHGNVFTEDRPKAVKFFKDKVSLAMIVISIFFLNFLHSFAGSETNRIGPRSHSRSMRQ